MCHYMSVGSRVHRGHVSRAGAEQESGRSRSDAELQSSEEKQERQVQRQV